MAKNLWVEEIDQNPTLRINTTLSNKMVTQLCKCMPKKSVIGYPTIIAPARDLQSMRTQDRLNLTPAQSHQS